MEPGSNQDWRPIHARKAVHQQVPAPDADRHGEHNVLELLRSDGTRVWDWDMDVGDLRSSVNGLFPAERNDGGDALGIGTRQLLCIFEAAEIEPFPNLRHLFGDAAPRVLEFTGLRRQSSRIQSGFPGFAGFPGRATLSRKIVRAKNLQETLKLFRIPERIWLVGLQVSASAQSLHQQMMSIRLLGQNSNQIFVLVWHNTANYRLDREASRVLTP